MFDKSRAGGVFKITCRDPQGNLKWETQSHNLVVNEGLQDMNTKYFTGSGYSAAWFVGLITGPTAATITATDTLASKAWTEFTSYTGNRKAAVFGTATTADPSVINNTASKAQFAITSAGDIVGAFLCAADTGTPTLFSASNFSSPGNRTVANGDTINVEYTFSLDAA